jgi:hypothetical protein
MCAARATSGGDFRVAPMRTHYQMSSVAYVGCKALCERPEVDGHATIGRDPPSPPRAVRA